AELRRNHIGFVFQDFHLLPNLTALENVLLPAVFSGTITNLLIDRVREMLAVLQVRTDSTPSVLLSRGERQRVAVARGLVNNPDVLFADEPTGNLDEASEDVLFDLLDRLRAERGFALAAVVHSKRVLERADRILHLEDGVLHEIR
ncbi:MAG: ATP-binding cassette domain-containing protein, partial [FCB group bacterium]|nr:ATP-binding cassette domain-containing protein [FCB group bacterium]